MSQHDRPNSIDTAPESELERLRQSLYKAEESRLSGEQTLSLDEARARLREKLGNGSVNP